MAPKSSMSALLFIGCLLFLNVQAKEIGQLVSCSMKACVEDPGKYFEFNTSYYVMRTCADGMFYDPLRCGCSLYYPGFLQKVGYTHYINLLRKIRYIPVVHSD
ncbi:uncharacterized protein LOC118768338 [Octopus sinensis]|nr:uncharacterized protein LOC118768338 [Octopus sinensis]XP_036370491.1 uncharacterized protein LOC118768338 [Octopus sinensis]